MSSYSFATYNKFEVLADAEKSAIHDEVVAIEWDAWETIMKYRHALRPIMHPPATRPKIQFVRKS